MSESIQAVLFAMLGAVGLVALGLLPYRGWQLLRLLLTDGLRPARRGVLLSLALAVVVVGVAIDLEIARRIYRCLNETYCGPNVASGWIYLSMLGAVYLAFELLSYLMRKAHRARGLGDATSGMST